MDLTQIQQQRVVGKDRHPRRVLAGNMRKEKNNTTDILIRTYHLMTIGTNGNGGTIANRSFQGNLSFSTRDPFGNSSLRYDQEESRISQKRDGSFGEQRSFVQDNNHLNEDGMYLNSTTEFFPVEDQDEQVYLEQYSEGKQLCCVELLQKTDHGTSALLTGVF
jgi:hypothetical protein